MLGRLNHVAIAVKDAEKAAKIYGGAFGAEISGAVPLPEHGVITVFVTLPNTKIEFIQPLGEASPNSSSAMPTAASITFVTTCPTSSPRATS
jgi:methylmalonyl-CoA/ethylmalonyl-CoA epimerase